MIKYTDIISEKYTLSASMLVKNEFKNPNFKYLKDLLSRELLKTDNGKDIGTASYIKDSDYYFLKTKALQNNSFIPILDNEAVQPMNKKAFIDYKLKQGDILISKDSNIGECIILNNDLPNYMPCGALYRLPIEKNKLYILAFIKTDLFKMQLDQLVPKGATIRHAGKKFLDCKIPFPKNNDNQKISLVEKIVSMIINKEHMIQYKNNKIKSIINEEIEKLSVDKNDSVFKKTNVNDIFAARRLDATYFSTTAKYQKYLIHNYPLGVKKLSDLGYTLKRGQNLQVSFIGKSIYSETPKEGFYTVIKPTNFSDYGTVEDFEYLGNKNKLQTLDDGDIVFSAEGTVGKCVLFTKTSEKWITNIHGIVLKSDSHDIKLSSFVSCILRFYKEWGYYEHFTVGGQGGSLGKNYWDSIVIPMFDETLRSIIATLYHNVVKSDTLKNIDELVKYDQTWNENAGIIEIDSSLRILKRILNGVTKNIYENVDIQEEDILHKLNKIYL